MGDDLVQRTPGLRFFVSTAGRGITEMVAFVFSASLFYLVYRHASPRRLPRRAALAGSLFTALLFEVAKRLYGWYLHSLAVVDRFSADANLGAVILFVVWLYYTALVFLLGAVVAETWDLLGRQRRAPTIRPPASVAEAPRSRYYRLALRRCPSPMPLNAMRLLALLLLLPGRPRLPRSFDFYARGPYRAAVPRPGLAAGIPASGRSTRCTTSSSRRSTA